MGGRLTFGEIEGHYPLITLNPRVNALGFFFLIIGGANAAPTNGERYATQTPRL